MNSVSERFQYIGVWFGAMCLAACALGLIFGIMKFGSSMGMNAKSLFEVEPETAMLWPTIALVPIGSVRLLIVPKQF